MAKKNGRLDFNAHNYMYFMATETETDDGMVSGPAHQLQWQASPREMAIALREAADWLDKHAELDMNVEID